MSEPAIFLVLAAAVAAQPSLPQEDQGFEVRFAQVATKTSTVFVVRAPETRTKGPAPKTVRAPLGAAQGITAVLGPKDVRATVRRRSSELSMCFALELADRPSWRGRAIVDLAVRRNGRVSEIAISPEHLRTRQLGRCLLRRVSQWRFPRFSGETEPGVTREAINVSFALRFFP